MSYRYKLVAFLPVAGLALLLAAGRAVSGPADLEVGTDPKTVIAQFGVPHEATLSARGMTFRYRGADREMHAFVFHAGVAISVPKKEFRPAVIKPVPAKKAYSGQPVREAVQRLGQPARVRYGTATIQAEYEDGVEVCFADGHVFVQE